MSARGRQRDREDRILQMLSDEPRGWTAEELSVQLDVNIDHVRNSLSRLKRQMRAKWNAFYPTGSKTYQRRWIAKPRGGKF